MADIAFVTVSALAEKVGRLAHAAYWSPEHRDYLAAKAVEAFDELAPLIDALRKPLAPAAVALVEEAA